MNDQAISSLELLFSLVVSFNEPVGLLARILKDFNQ